LEEWQDVLQPPADDRNGAPSPAPVLGDDERVAVGLEAGQEEAAVGRDAVEQVEAVVAQIEQSCAAAHENRSRWPRTHSPTRFQGVLSLVRSGVSLTLFGEPVSTLITMWSLAAALVWFVRQAA